MSIPKDVRQRMINVMYIVLLALLALQIPKEVTQAFLKINQGIEASNFALAGMTQSNISAIIQKGKNGDNIAVDYGERSQKINQAAAELNEYIEQIKTAIIDKVGVDDEGILKSPEETILTSEVLIKGKENGINDGLAYALKDEISKSMKAMLDEFPKADLEKNRSKGAFDQLISALPIYDLNYQQSDKAIWVMETFDQMPAAGAIAMLSQIQSEVKTSENKLIEELKSLINVTPAFDVLKAQIAAPSTYILQGEPFKANLFLSASSSTSDNISIFANGRTYRPGADGMVHFEEIANSVGEHKLSGHINVKNTNTGKNERIPFNDFTYNVAAPYANVNPTKMNVLYIGVDNPINASAAGVLNQDLQVSISQGSITGSNGVYNAKVTQQGQAIVTVKDKKGRKHGEFKFRAKRLPDPVAIVANKQGGISKSAVFKAQIALKTEIPYIEYDINFEVLSYDMVYMPYGDDITISKATSATFPPQMKRYMQMAKPRDRYSFENIRVRGPDGDVRRIPAISFRIM